MNMKKMTDAVERFRLRIADFWLSQAENDLQALRNQLAELPREAQIALLDAEREHRDRIKQIQRIYRRAEISLGNQIRMATHELDVLIDRMGPRSEERVIRHDFRAPTITNSEAA